MTYLQAAVIGALQGVTELFPISSLGHAVLIPQLFGWNLKVDEPFYLTFLVATHLATAAVLVAFFLSDWVKIIRGLGRSVRQGRLDDSDRYARLGWLIVAATVPAGAIGLLLQKQIETLFASPKAISAFLVANGLVLLAAEYWRAREPVAEDAAGSDERIASLSFTKSIGVGTAQAIALIPGFSRSGVTMAGGLLAGLSNEDAARFSFLLATPIIGAAAVLKTPSLFAEANRAVLGPSLLGAVSAGVGAYLSARFLVRYFERNRLWPFAIYCLVVGAASVVFLVLR